MKFNGLFFAFALMVLANSPVFAHQDPEIAGYIKVDGGRIWYRLNGARHLGGDTAAVIAIHGGPGGTHRSGMPLVALSIDRPVILYDQLDTGNSDRPGDQSKWTVERYVSEVDAIREALGLKKVVVIGHSWGGSIAAVYAARNPPGLAGVVLSSPLISTRRWIADTDAYRRQLPEDVQRALSIHEAAGTTNSPEYRAAEQAFYDRHMCRKDPCPGREYRQGGPKGNAVLYETMWGPSEFHAPGTLKNFDAGPGLAGIDIPTLMICGEFDEAAPATCRDFAGRIRGARTVIVPGAGHATRSETEDFYMAEIRRFLDENGL